MTFRSRKRSAEVGDHHADDSEKRMKTETNSASDSYQSRPGASFKIDSNGDRYWEISKMRRVTISTFRGKTMVNIREYYEKDGKELPGKKVLFFTQIFTGAATYTQMDRQIQLLMSVRGPYRVSPCQWTNTQRSLPCYQRLKVHLRKADSLFLVQTTPMPMNNPKKTMTTRANRAVILMPLLPRKRISRRQVTKMRDKPQVMMKMIRWKFSSVRYRIIDHVLNNLSYIYIRGLVCSGNLWGVWESMVLNSRSYVCHDMSVRYNHLDNRIGCFQWPLGQSIKRLEYCIPGLVDYISSVIFKHHI